MSQNGSRQNNNIISLKYSNPFRRIKRAPAFLWNWLPHIGTNNIEATTAATYYSRPETKLVGCFVFDEVGKYFYFIPVSEETLFLR